VASEAEPIRRPRFVYLLTLAQRRLQSAIQDGGRGNTAARSGLLMALRPSADAVQAKDLGEVLGIGAPALSGLLDRMERDGLIERRPDPRDGRASVIRLTGTGRQQRAAAVASARRLNDNLCEGFDDAELAVVVRWLSAVATKFLKEKSSD